MKHRRDSPLGREALYRLEKWRLSSHLWSLSREPLLTQILNLNFDTFLECLAFARSLEASSRLKQFGLREIRSIRSVLEINNSELGESANALIMDTVWKEKSTLREFGHLIEVDRECHRAS